MQGELIWNAKDYIDQINDLKATIKRLLDMIRNLEAELGFCDS